MCRISKALELASAEFEKEHKGMEFEEGEEFATVFNDGIIIIGLDNTRQLKIKVLAGKPYRVDYDLKLLEENDHE